MSPTSSAARTTAACQGAGSATMTMTVGITQTRRAAVCPPTTLPSHPTPTDLGRLPSQHPCLRQAAPGQVAASQGWGSGAPSLLTPPLPTPCRVFEFVPFHLISCFSPFSHCPLGVAEVGVSDVPLLPPHPLPLPQSPPVPVLCLGPSSFTGLSLNPGACLSGLVPLLFPSTPHTQSVPRAEPGTHALSCVSAPEG